jgi:acetoacetyl-CoA synthetase
MDSIPHWFEGTRLNYAENILYTSDPQDKSKRTTEGKEDSKVAITEVREGCTQIRHLTWAALRQKVGRLSQAMRAAGVRKGDRVAVVASNSIDTVVVFFAITALGGLFSSSSTDMGVKGVLDRLTQIKPRWLFMDDVAVYNGKTVDLRGKMTDIVKGMDGVSEFDGVVSMPRFDDPADVSKVPRAQTLVSYLAQASSDELVFERVEFRDPFLVVYSSGTTGQPKCIVHSVGGVVISANKEGRLHREQGPDSSVLQYTTTGWIMYLASVQTLMFGCRCVMYDGSPFIPDLARFVKLVGEEK